MVCAIGRETLLNEELVVRIFLAIFPSLNYQKNDTVPFLYTSKPRSVKDMH